MPVHYDTIKDGQIKKKSHRSFSKSHTLSALSVTYSCFVASHPLYFGVILPIGIILLHNLVIFGVVIRVLWKSKVGESMTQANSFTAAQRLKNAISVSILMGLTWLFGFLAIEDAEFFFSLLFCLCNSFQGIVIFILFCARQDDVKANLRPYYNRICCVRINDLRRLSQTANTGLPSGLELGIKSPDNVDDQITPISFESVNSVDGESTNQPTVLSDVETETTVPDENKNDTTKEGIKVPPLNDAEDMSKVADDSTHSSKLRVSGKKPHQYKRRIFSIYSVFVSFVGGDHEEPGLQQPASDNNEKKRETRDGDGNTNKGVDVLDDEDRLVVPIDVENVIKDARKKSNKVPPLNDAEDMSKVADDSTHSSKIRVSGKKPHQYKRRIFSIYSVLVSFVGGEHEEPGLQQPASDNNEKQRETRDGDGNTNKGVDVLEDEDRLVAPIDVENVIKDAHVENDIN